jgi:uncharacterized membrane protein (UPF0127 family)
LKLQQMAIGNGAAQSLRVLHAQTAAERMRGLLGRGPLGPGEAMLLRPCRLVHTFGMRYALDLVFLDRACVVRRIAPSVPPGRVRGCWRAWQTLELPAGGASAIGVAVGDALPLGHSSRAS